MAKSNEQTSLKQLDDAISAGDETKLIEAVEAVERAGLKGAQPALLELLRKDARIGVKNAAALALSDMHVQEAVPLLVSLIRARGFKGQDGTLVYALQGLDWFREHAIEVGTLLTDKSFEVRLSALNALEQALPQLTQQQKTNFAFGIIFPVLAGRMITEDVKEMVLEAAKMLLGQEELNPQDLVLAS